MSPSAPKILIEKQVEIFCINCGERSEKHHTYLLENARTNPKSSGYHKDSLVWCSDYSNHSCDQTDCLKYAKQEAMDQGGFQANTSFHRSESFEHMFWERKVEPFPEIAEALMCFSNERNMMVALGKFSPLQVSAEKAKAVFKKMGAIDAI